MLTRSQGLLEARSRLAAVDAELVMAGQAIPADQAFNEIRQALAELRIDVRSRIRELTTYASAAATIESAGGSS